ncbi:uncharacterized protein gem isoform X2 [Eurosta solidaginis]|uniref:uncharacterized protein gem isoform X2 n=1 Tax=Eurosta solidaginis TaxID=178769 RepID=UPI0035313445
MALSLLSQHQQPPNYFDLQTLFDPFSFQPQQQHLQYPHNPYQQQQQQQQFQVQHLSQYHQQLDDQQQRQQQQLLQHPTKSKTTAVNVSSLKINSTTRTTNFFPNQMEYIANNLHQNQNHNHTPYQQQQQPNNNNNNDNNSSIINNIRKSSSIIQNNNNSQILSKTNRCFINGYSHQKIASDYIITFVDSPPNSEESWKGRGNWTEDIGFDLNTDFNSNSYLSNESFLSFSPALTVLKQEPQADQLKTNKSPLNTIIGGSIGSIQKLDKTSSNIVTAPTTEDTPKNALNTSLCGCGSPKVGNSPEIEQNGNNIEKSNSSGAIGFGNAGSSYSGVDKNTVQGNPVPEQLTVAGVSKVDNCSKSVASSGNNNANAHSDDHKFQYILAAATSIATKNNEETLTYLNQGQSYEIKLKKIGDLSFYRDKILKSVIKICFHERRLQFMEREQMQQWQASRPGERIIEVDVPLSYGLCHVSQPLNPNFLNTVEIFWDPLKEVGVYIKVNCISTEFTPKKHGGEKGVPFRLQIETYIESTNSSGSPPAAASVSAVVSTSGTAGTATVPSQIGNAMPSGLLANFTTNHNANNNLGHVNGKQQVHAAACQIKVFKLKGADRKHKQDREKIQRRPQAEQEKFQPSYECTIMNDVPLELITTAGASSFSPECMKIWPNSPAHIPKYDGILPYAGGSPNTNSSPIAINSVTSTNSPTLKIMDANMVSPPQSATPDMDEYVLNILPESSPSQVAQWLSHNRLTSYLSTFVHFSGSDILRMSKEDLIQICGIADGIRMFNMLRAKAIVPRLTIYVSLDGNSYNAIYMVSNTSKELMQKLCKMPGFYDMVANGATNGPTENSTIYNSWSMHSKYSGSGSNIYNDSTKSFIYLFGPSGVLVNVTDEVLNNEIKDGSLHTLEVQNGKVVMKLINKNDN